MASNKTAMEDEGKQMCSLESCFNRTQLNSTSECCSDQHEPVLANKTKVILISIHVFLIIVSVFGNSLVFKAFHKFSSLRTASNVILVSLCAADSLITIAYVPRIVLITSHRYEPWRNDLCMASAWFSFILISVIILHLALISVERLIAVKLPLRYQSIVTNRRALIASVAMWLWVLAETIFLPEVLRLNSKKAYVCLRQSLHPCSETKEGSPDEVPPSTKGYLIFLVTSMLFIPLMIILCSYSYIFIVSRKHRKQIQKEEDSIQEITTIRHEMRGARTLAIVVVVCLLSIFPLLVVWSLRFSHALPVSQQPELWCVKYIVYDVAFGLNAICNPLIYAWKNEKFRSSFQKLLKCA